MSVDLINRTIPAATLKTSLDGISGRVRMIADRIANASANPRGFQLPADGSAAPGEAFDLEKEMASLADEQLRFDATARLLQKTYAGLRASLRGQ
jgi:hypothetical protein